MIALRGTLLIRHDGCKAPLPYDVVGATEDDFLVASDRGRPREASTVGTPIEFIPERQVVPAAPGWVAEARWAGTQEGKDWEQTETIPIVAWQIGREGMDERAVPIGLTSREGDTPYAVPLDEETLGSNGSIVRLHYSGDVSELSVPSEEGGS